jgi:hypothetical protein
VTAQNPGKSTSTRTKLTPYEKGEIHQQGRKLIESHGINCGKGKYCSIDALKQLADKLQVEYDKRWSREDAIRAMIGNNGQNANHSQHSQFATTIDSIDFAEHHAVASETSTTTTTVCV